MTRNDWTFLRTQLQAFIAGEPSPSIRDPKCWDLTQKIGEAIAADDRAQLAALGCAALAAMLEHVQTSARAERETALFIDLEKRS